MAVIAGPTLGGIIASLVGTTAAFVVDAVSFLVSATLLLTVRIPFTRAKASGGRLLAEVWSGFRYVLNNGVLLGAILIIGASVLGAAALNALEPLYARQISTKGELTFGLMVTAWGGGMLGGAILLMRVGEKWGWRRLFLGGILLLGLAVERVAASSYLPIVLVFLAIGGIGNSLTAILLNTILQQSVPGHFRGRVFAFAGLTIQSMQMGAILLWGWRAQHFPLRSILAVAGLVALVAFPIGWTLWPFRDYTYASKKDLQALIDR
ncbi:MAG: MFS transporter [Firmicutes bacterium]|nr:MFS transporter [Bacillota bacterium]